MKTYDYSNATSHTDALLKVVDHLSDKEADLALNAIQTFKEDYIITQQEAGASWFLAAIIPLLQDFSEITSSIMDVEEIGKAAYIVTIKNKCGLDISEDRHAMKIALNIAKYIAVNTEDDFTTLTLIFDCSDFIG